MSTEPKESPPKAPYATRTAEAKACLVKAKLHLGNSRNLKTDIKAEVTQAIERLYTLVKEAEAEAEVKEGNSQSSGTFLPSGKVLGDGEVEGLQVEPGEAVSNKLIQKLENHERLLKESSEAIERLKNVLESKTIEGEKTTYAAVTASGAPRRSPIQATLHSIVVSSKDEQETGEEVLKQIRETVNAKDGWVKVERVRKAKDRKIIIGCRTEEDRRKIKEKIECTEKRLTCEVVNNKDPLLILKDVLLMHSDEDIIKAIKNQNEGIFQNLDPRDHRIAIKYRKKARNPLTGHIVIATSPTVWKRVTDAGTLHIDLQRIRAEDQSPLVQCTRCLGYGHGKRFCKQTIDLCSHCGGPHLRSECTEWISGAPSSCKNCTLAKYDQKDHNAFSQACPVRRKWDTLARSSVAYC